MQPNLRRYETLTVLNINSFIRRMKFLVEQ